MPLNSRVARRGRRGRPSLEISRIAAAVFATAITLQTCTPLARATGAHPDAIVGYWQRGEGEAVVEIRRRGDHYDGVIVASERRPETIGTEIFKSLRFDAERRCWQGRVYSMARDREFSIEMTLPDPNRFVISLRVLFIRKTVQFNRQQNL
jgi:uncharacterized protein (DUF2147 family)